MTPAFQPPQRPDSGDSGNTNATASNPYRSWQQAKPPSASTTQLAPGPQTAKETGLFDSVLSFVKQIAPGGDRATQPILSGHEKGVIAVAFNSLETKLVSAGLDATVRLWNLDTQEIISECNLYTDNITKVGFTPSGHRYYACCINEVGFGKNSGTVYLWDTQTGQKVAQMDGADQLAFSPDGQWMIAGSKDNLIHLWEAETGRPVRKFIGNGHPITQCKFSPDGKRIIAANNQGAIRVWDFESGQETLRLFGHADSITSFDVSADGQRLVSASRDGTIRVWDLETGLERVRLTDKANHGTRVSFLGRNNQFIAQDYSSIVRFDADTGEQVKHIKLRSTHKPSMIALLEKHRLAIVGYEKANEADIISLDTNKVLDTLIGHTYTLYCATYGPKNKWIATGAGDFDIRLWTH